VVVAAVVAQVTLQIMVVAVTAALALSSLECLTILSEPSPVVLLIL
jgi:hypothetical protein